MSWTLKYVGSFKKKGVYTVLMNYFSFHHGNAKSSGM